MLNTIKAIIRLLLFLCFTAFFLLIFVVSLPFGGCYKVTPLWHRVCLWIFSIKLEVKNKTVGLSPCLYVANHVSYLDIIILGSLVKGASFVAKAEVRQWPLFGWLSTLQNTVYINRKSREIKIQLQQLSTRVEQGDDLIIFPEGTSTDGKQVKVFKSSLFAICELHNNLQIQPVAMKYVSTNGNELTQSQREQYAFYADFSFGSHFWKMLKGNGIKVQVTYTQPILLAETVNRKELSTIAFNRISENLVTL